MEERQTAGTERFQLGNKWTKQIVQVQEGSFIALCILYHMFGDELFKDEMTEGKGNEAELV